VTKIVNVLFNLGEPALDFLWWRQRHFDKTDY